MKLTKVPPFMPAYIGICGASRAGKDSTAQAFTDFGYRRVGFADRLKNLAWAVNPILRSEVEWQREEPWGTRPVADALRLHDLVGENTTWGWEQAKDLHPEVRQFLIDLGNGCRDELYSDVWVRTLLTEEEPPIVVPDVRFINEAECLRARGACVIVRVTRPGRKPSEFEREVNLIEADIELVNDGDLEDLRVKAQEALLDLLAHRAA